MRSEPWADCQVCKPLLERAFWSINPIKDGAPSGSRLLSSQCTPRGRSPRASLQGKAPVPSLHLTCKASSETADRLRKAHKWLQQESTRADDKRKGYSFTRELVGTKGCTLSWHLLTVAESGELFGLQGMCYLQPGLAYITLVNLRKQSPQCLPYCAIIIFIFQFVFLKDNLF